jgi:homoserine O-acetyltransferase/O-succinyltransferase
MTLPHYVFCATLYRCASRSKAQAYSTICKRVYIDTYMTGALRIFSSQEGIPLVSGATLAPLEVGFETWGNLNREKTNAVLICHALTGDQYVAGPNPVTGRPAWWDNLVGPGRVIDTDRYFVICSNVLGGCFGTTGPASLAPSGQPYGLDFPVITIADMVRAQAALIDSLGIETLFAVIGGSMGGMQVLEWIASRPERVFAAMPIATAARHSAQNIAFHEVGRQAIMADPDWQDGTYHTRKKRPVKGLAVARMAAHITYLSDMALHRKFGRRLQDRDSLTFGFEADFQIESYLRYQGHSFVDRFDANSYLYITRAMDYFDLAASFDGRLSDAFAPFKGKACVVSFSSDWHYPPADSRHITRAMIGAGIEVSAFEVDTDKGHDAFLLDEPDFHAAMAGFLGACAAERGIS